MINSEKMETQHTPVLLEEVIEYLQPQDGSRFIDATVGGGGYLLELARSAGEKGEIIGIDMDEKALQKARERATQEGVSNISFVQGNFRDIEQLVGEGKGFDGIVMDLGLSSDQLEDRERGFSFKEDRPVEMSFSSDGSTQRILNKTPEEELKRILKEYGEEKFAPRIAQRIVEERKEQEITHTQQLKEIIKKAVPTGYYRKIDPATKTFQALRIASNEELKNLAEALPGATKLLRPGGRIAVVSYHSLEDRIVKNYFKQESKDCICPPQNWSCDCGHSASLKILTKKVIFPSTEEVRQNPRARSARLRVAEKI